MSETLSSTLAGGEQERSVALRLVVDPRKLQRDYRDFWMLGISKTNELGRKLFDQVVHCDWTGRRASRASYEPRKEAA